jgi:xylan 1,4-beta-xylosidase
MHSPSQLTKGQVELLKKASAGTPVSSQLIQINNSGNWKNEFPLRENDVYFVTLDKIGR